MPCTPWALRQHTAPGAPARRERVAAAALDWSRRRRRRRWTAADSCCAPLLLPAPRNPSGASSWHPVASSHLLFCGGALWLDHFARFHPDARSRGGKRSSPTEEPVHSKRGPASSRKGGGNSPLSVCWRPGRQDPAIKGRAACCVRAASAWPLSAQRSAAALAAVQRGPAPPAVRSCGQLLIVSHIWVGPAPGAPPGRGRARRGRAGRAREIAAPAPADRPAPRRSSVVFSGRGAAVLTARLCVSASSLPRSLPVRGTTRFFRAMALHAHARAPCSSRRSVVTPASR